MKRLTHTKRTPAPETVALVNGEEPVAVRASGELAHGEPMDDAWFKRRVLELMYDMGEFKERVRTLEAEREARA